MVDPQPRSNFFGRLIMRALILLVLAVATTLTMMRVHERHTPAGRWLHSLRSDDASVRLAAAALMRDSVGLSPETVFAGLDKALSDSDAAVRAQAATTLQVPIFDRSDLGGGEPDLELVDRARQSLGVLLNDLEPSVRAAAVGSLISLARHSGRDAEVAPILIRSLRDPDASVRLAAAWGAQGHGHRLPRIEIRTPEVQGAWLAAIDDEAPAVRQLAFMALAQFGGEESIAREIIRRLDDPDEITRVAACSALRGIARPPLGVATDLLDVLERLSARERPPLALADQAMIPVSWSGDLPRSYPVFASASMFMHDDQIAEAAAEALARMGPAAQKVVADLAGLLEVSRANGNDRVELALAGAIGGIAPGSPEGARAVERLAELIRERATDVFDLTPIVAVGSGWLSAAKVSEGELLNRVARFGVHANPALGDLHRLAMRSTDDFNRRSIQGVIEEVGAIEVDAP